MDSAGGSSSITIALLTRNAGPLLDRVLAGNAAQQTSRRVEVLAIDSGSTDGTVDRLRAYGARVLLTDPQNFDFGRSRDFAFEQSRGGIIVSLSQDAVPAHSRWLENLIAPLADPNIAMSSGRSIPDSAREHSQFAWERNGWFYFTREMSKFREAHGRGVSFANCAVRRSAWARLRIDAQVLGEDFQFQMKAQLAGWTAAFPENAEVLHHHQYDVQGLWGRCRNEGLAMRQMGFSYRAGDLARDLLSPAKFVQWLREVRHGRMDSVAAAVFPVLRPLAVYTGNRFGREYRPYVHRAKDAA